MGKDFATRSIVLQKSGAGGIAGRIAGVIAGGHCWSLSSEALHLQCLGTIREDSLIRGKRELGEFKKNV